MGRGPLSKEHRMRKLIYLAAAAALLALGAFLGRERAEARRPSLQPSQAIKPGWIRGYGKVVELVPPSGLDLDPGTNIESREDGTGAIFVAGTTKKGEAVVWKQVPTWGHEWRSVAVDLGKRFEGGRGSLSVEWDSNLYLTVWGKGARVYRVRVPGWAAGDTPK
jgi:hypothetical protein